MPTAKVVNTIDQLHAERVILNHYPNGTYDPFELLQDNNGNVRCQRRDTQNLAPILFGDGGSEEANSGVTRGTFDTLAATVTTHDTDIGDNATDITTNQGNITTNQGNITTNQGNITTNQGEIATVESMVDASVRFITFTVDFQTSQLFESTYVCGPGARVQEVRLIIDGSVDQRTPVSVDPFIEVQFKNGAIKTIMEWSSTANVTIPAGIVSIPQWTANDGGSAGGDEITVLQQGVTFQNNATPSYTVMVGVIETALT